MPFLTSNITISKVDWWEQKISSLQCGDNAVVEFYIFRIRYFFRQELLWCKKAGVRGRAYIQQPFSRAW